MGHPHHAGPESGQWDTGLVGGICPTYRCQGNSGFSLFRFPVLFFKGGCSLVPPSTQ